MSDLHTLTQNRHIRIFVSSSFEDMKTERDLLASEIFPPLRQRCRERGVEFTTIDLRSGIPDGSGLSFVVETCLLEVADCHPFFIGLVGDYYAAPRDGDDYHRQQLIERNPLAFDWLQDAPAASVTELEIRQLFSHAHPNIAETTHFYWRDPSYIDAPSLRHMQSLFAHMQTAWQNGGLHALEAKLRACKDNLLLQQLESALKAHLKKVRLAAQKDENKQTLNVFETLQQLTASDISIALTAFNEALQARQAALAQLKTYIQAQAVPISEYAAPQDLLPLVQRDLETLIDTLYPLGSELTPLERDRLAHDAFAAARTRLYLPRADDMARLDQHAAHSRASALRGTDEGRSAPDAQSAEASCGAERTHENEDVAHPTWLLWYT